MYVLAQRVWSPVRRADGVNAFLHLHDQDPVPTSWTDIEYIASFLPGRTAVEEAPLPPGGNRVLSYLEAAGPDEALPRELASALDEVASELGDKQTAQTVGSGMVMARFFLGHRPPDVRSVATEEFAALREVLESLVSRFQRGAIGEVDSTAPREPLLVWRDLTEDGMEFSLDASSRHRLQAEVVERVFETTVRVELTRRQEFERRFGEALETQVIPALVPVPRARITALGGVELRDRATGETLLRCGDDEGRAA